MTQQQDQPALVGDQDKPILTRRGFLAAAALSSGGLWVGVSLPGCGGADVDITEIAELTGNFRPNAWVTVTPESRVVMQLNKAEMGQGVMTSHAMLVAEELEVPVEAVDVEFAPAADVYKTNLGYQMTGGSTSVKEAYVPLRKAAATARVMLIAAGAQQLGVAASACKAENGHVVHTASGKKLPYGELTKLAAGMEIPEAPIKRPEDFKLVGKPVGRVDARMKVDGTGQFGIDASVEGMLKAAIIHPPVMGATAVSIDDTKARAMDGVTHVIPFERGVAVLAEKYWQAKRAAATLDIQWSRGKLAGLDSAAVIDEARAYARNPGRNVRDEGDVDNVLDGEGLTTIEAVYEAPYLSHSPMEPQNCIAHVHDGKVEVWGPVQSATLVVEVAARAAGVSRDDVTVTTTLLGGGFGRRIFPDFVIEAVVLSQKVGRPVQVIWTRESDTQQGFYRPISVNLLRGSVDDGGRPVAWSHHAVSQPITNDQTTGMSALFPEWIPTVTRRMFARSATALFTTASVPDFLATEGASQVPYDIENVRVAWSPINCRLPVSFWRSVGHSFNGFVVESFIDELAHAASKDPYEFRRALLPESSRARRCLDAVAEMAQWGNKKLPKGRGQGIAVHESFGSVVAEVVEASVERGRIRVHDVQCAIELGVVINPDIVKAQMESAIIYGLSAAMKQEIVFKDGVVQQGNFDTYRSLRMYESPTIGVKIIESSAAPTGAGEPGLPPAAPALANAVFAATGVRMRRLPFEKALAELEEGR